MLRYGHVHAKQLEPTNAVNNAYSVHVINRSSAQAAHQARRTDEPKRVRSFSFIAVIPKLTLLI